LGEVVPTAVGGEEQRVIGRESLKSADLLGNALATLVPRPTLAADQVAVLRVGVGIALRRSSSCRAREEVAAYRSARFFVAVVTVGARKGSGLPLAEVERKMPPVAPWRPVTRPDCQ